MVRVGKSYQENVFESQSLARAPKTHWFTQINMKCFVVYKVVLLLHCPNKAVSGATDQMDLITLSTVLLKSYTKESYMVTFN